ncbi:MAG: MTH938/NDUFAF3 family protein [Archaeoglobaceae archaeon]|nr:MTH938/NDUFAF3 family protein [Archaeoglobaceae archaeon]MCX8152351.1 MTH938/NDUFAF3 family protein [Archaeoglobaceae archaeon]MDW8014190.1 MTH938/NDUFAF3 family protein [Archaeoglobaceae archaeon]
MIEEYSFGTIKISGKIYKSDLIVGKEVINQRWWRKQGHKVQLEDIPEILNKKPEVVIFGTGANGKLVVDGKVVDELKKIGCEVVIARSDEAVKKFNELLKAEKDVVLAIHLTC